MTRKKKIRCYQCRKFSTSKEHVPPKCLFPEQKDIGNLDFKKELITVPSCDKHNSKKSNDDEFLLVTLSGILKNNDLGLYHRMTKVERTLQNKKSDYFFNQILRNPQIKTLDNEKGIIKKVAYGDPDISRLVSSFRSISFGLFWNKEKKRWKGDIKIILGFIDYYNPKHQKLVDVTKHIFDNDKRALGYEGANPAVFKYQFYEKDEYGLIGLKMVFYGSCDVYATFIPKNTELPKSPVKTLIDAGIPTIVNTNGNVVEFNMEEE